MPTKQPERESEPVQLWEWKKGKPTDPVEGQFYTISYLENPDRAKYKNGAFWWYSEGFEHRISEAQWQHIEWLSPVQAGEGEKTLADFMSPEEMSKLILEDQQIISEQSKETVSFRSYLLDNFGQFSKNKIVTGEEDSRQLVETVVNHFQSQLSEKDREIAELKDRFTGRYLSELVKTDGWKEVEKVNGDMAALIVADHSLRQELTAAKQEIERCYMLLELMFKENKMREYGQRFNEKKSQQFTSNDWSKYCEANQIPTPTKNDNNG